MITDPTKLRGVRILVTDVDTGEPVAVCIDAWRLLGRVAAKALHTTEAKLDLEAPGGAETGWAFVRSARAAGKVTRGA